MKCKLYQQVLVVQEVHHHHVVQPLLEGQMVQGVLELQTVQMVQTVQWVQQVHVVPALQEIQDFHALLVFQVLPAEIDKNVMDFVLQNYLGLWFQTNKFLFDALWKQYR